MVSWSKYIIGLMLFAVAMFGACKKEDEVDKKQVEHDQIEQYVTDNNLNGYFTASGLYYIVVEEGTGGHPVLSSKVTVAYKAYGFDGIVRDESDYFTSQLENLILGWQESIPLMKEEGTSQLIVPSHLAYNDGIWVFDVTLFAFAK